MKFTISFILIYWICLVTRGEDPTSTQVCPRVADIAILLDSSESLNSQQRWLSVRNFIIHLLESLPISAGAVRVSVIPFSSSARVIHWFNDEQSWSSVQTSILTHTAIGGNTNISGAIRLARKQVFTVTKGDRPGVRNVILIVTDGASNLDTTNTYIAAREAKAQNIQIFTLGIGDKIDKHELEEISSDPASYHSVISPDFESLNERLRHQLIDHICHPVPTPIPFCNSKADLVFVIDSSGSIRDKNPADESYDNWQLLLSFVTRIISSMTVSQSSTRVAVIQYSEDVKVMLHLNQAQSTKQVIEFVEGLEHWSGATNTSGAIKFLRTEIFRERRGDRINAPNVAIIITDGESGKPVQTQLEATLAKQQGILMFTVGVTNSTDVKELTSIASLPKQEHYFNSVSIPQVTRLLSKLIIHICQDSLCDQNTSSLTEQERYLKRIRCRELKEARCEGDTQLIWRRFPEHLLVGYNTARIPNVDNVNTCQLYCLQDPSCKSIDYAADTHECSISKTVNHQQKLAPDQGADYYEWACLDQSGSGSPNGTHIDTESSDPKDKKNPNHHINSNDQGTDISSNRTGFSTDVMTTNKLKTQINAAPTFSRHILLCGVFNFIFVLINNA